MSRKEASAALVGFVMEGITAERDVLIKADSQALGGSSPAFSPQLWKSVGLAPKLMGARRERFLHELGLAQAPPPEGLDILPPVTVVAGSSRSARAVQRACRQRFASYQDAPEKGRSLKDLKAAAIAEFESAMEKQEKGKTLDRPNGSLSSKSSGKKSSGKDKPKSGGTPVKASSGEFAVGAASPTKQGSSSPETSKRVSETAVEMHVEVNTSSGTDKGGPGLCLHCMEKLGARPLLSCFDCKQVMHFDCYAEWAGAEPGPWDNVHCPAHKPVKKPRHRPGSTCTSPRAPPSRKPSMDLGKKLSVLASQPDVKEAISGATTPRGNTSPSSSDMTHDTHHSPARSEPFNVKLEQVAMSPKAGMKRPLISGDSKDEELAMRLHRELNAPTRRRRGEA